MPIYNSSGQRVNAANNNFAALNIGAIGDSITEGARVSAPDKNYVELLANDFAHAYNYGVSATTLAGTGSSAMCNRYSNMRNDLNIVIVYGGTNDWYTSVELGTSADATNETFYGALNVMIPGLIAKYPHSEIVFLTPMSSTYSGKNTDNANSAGYTMKQYVEAIKERCAYHAVPVLDLFAMCGMDIAHAGSDSDHFAYWTADGVHPNAQGHKRIYDRIIGFLHSIEGHGAALG